MKPIVFAGPSLCGVPARELEGVSLRPPARKGDLLQAHLDGAEVIGLIDGVFDLSPSVWHKEILYALAGGSAVYGAASLGALRAAECAAFGMTGIGGIYQDYAEGRRTADADVALVHAPAELDYQALTVALVDVEATLHAARDTGAITPDRVAGLLGQARALNFRTRTWAAIAAPFDPNLSAVLTSLAISRKRQDALALIAAILLAPAELASPAAGGFTLARTLYAENLLAHQSAR